MISSIPPRFKVWRPPSATPVVPQRLLRPSPQSRGYGSKWNRLSIAFRKRHPFCRFCEQEGRDSLADVVHHIKPVREFPELKYEWKNLAASCSFHHDGLCQKLEILARRTNQFDKLPLWCSGLEHRPAEVRVV